MPVCCLSCLLFAISSRKRFKMPSMKKLKKTMKSIKRFISALTRSRRRPSKEELKAVKRMRLVQRASLISRESSMASIVSDDDCTGSQQGITNQPSSSRAPANSNRSEEPCSLLPRISSELFFALLDDDVENESSAERVPILADPSVDIAYSVSPKQEHQTANVPTLPEAVETTASVSAEERVVKLEGLNIEETELPSLQLPAIVTVDLTANTPTFPEAVKTTASVSAEERPVKLENLNIEETELPSVQLPSTVTVEEEATLQVEPFDTREDVSLCLEQLSTSTDVLTSTDVSASEDLLVSLSTSEVVAAPFDGSTSQTTFALYEESFSLDVLVTAGPKEISDDLLITPKLTIPHVLPTIILTAPSEENLAPITLFKGTNQQLSKVSEYSGSVLRVITSRCSHNPLLELPKEMFTNKVSSQKIVLESCSPAQSLISLIGYARVANLGYVKNVFAHCTTDNWKTVTNVGAEYVSSNECLTADRFSFSLPVNTQEFALCYEVNGQTYWDNNHGNNYTMLH